MKLRNKKTGEIGYTVVLRSKAIFVMDENEILLGSYTSLAELNEEWEDYEEARKAVEKLKAWKRLKDKGFCFCGTDCINKNNVIYFEFGERPLEQEEVGTVEKDLDLLFGGE